MKKRINKFQKITIVTVVYNAEDFIEKTIKNVLNQNYPNLEYIIVYTPSHDKTFQIIKKYESKVDKILINNVLGIYQSMNLGAKFATGEYINYMNAGDFFYNKNTIRSIFNQKQHADVLYGHCKILYNNFSRFVQVSNLSNLINEMSFSHQSCFTKTKLQKKFGFQTKYYLSADHDLYLKLYLKKYRFKNLNKILSSCKANGIVNQKRFEAVRQNQLISLENCKNELSLFKKLKMINNIIYHIFVTIIKKILGEKNFKKILSLNEKIFK